MLGWKVCFAYARFCLRLRLLMCGVVFGGNLKHFNLTVIKKVLSCIFKVMENVGDPSYTEINLTKGKSYLNVIYSDALCISWRPSGDESVIMSQKILFEGKPDVNGGVPIVLPTYAPNESSSSHTWMKIESWEVKEGFNPNSDTITLIQKENDEIRNTWNYNFQIEFSILLLNETQLKLDTVVTNTGNVKFSFSCSFYSYFTVTDVVNDKMYGLNGCTFIPIAQEEKDNKSTENAKEQTVESGKKIKLSDLSHRIYKNTPSGQKIEKLLSNRSVKLEKYNLPDIVVYNPYADALSSLDKRIEEDCDDSNKEQTICIETGSVAEMVDLEPNKSHAAHLILTVE